MTVPVRFVKENKFIFPFTDTVPAGYRFKKTGGKPRPTASAANVPRQDRPSPPKVKTWEDKVDELVSQGVDVCIAQLTRTGDPTGRTYALRALMKLKNKKAIPPIRQAMLETDHRSVKVLAIQALGELGAQEAADDIQRLYSAPESSGFVKIAAKNALKALGIEPRSQESTPPREVETPSASDETFYRVVSVKSNDVLNMRKGPHWKKKLVEAISHDAKCIRHLGKKKRVGTDWWWKIEAASGRSGWVNSRYLDKYSGTCR